MLMEKTDPELLAQNQFPFYLSAWVYCRKHKISTGAIFRKAWDIWEVRHDNV